MAAQDAQSAERAIIVLSRALGHRQTLGLLWEHSARRARGTLGHHPIMAANTWRTLEALGWEHSEPVLRYLARSFASNESDRTYLPNGERVKKTLLSLRAGWTAPEPSRGATLELYATLREGRTDDACDLACAQLSRGVRAGAVWDAIHLVAGDLLFRYRTGGTVVGSYLVHAVTSTNALRCGFDSSGEDPTRLLLLLQAVAVLGDLFVTTGAREDQLRGMNLLDLKAGLPAAVALDEVFAMLPGKTGVPSAEYPESARRSSDEASRSSFALIQEPAAQAAFRQAARSLLCVKATGDPHDLKYPVAAFEDARSASPEWSPYLLASSVHALHGPASADSAILVAAREALRS
jgi:hypothetical protein